MSQRPDQTVAPSGLAAPESLAWGSHVGHLFNSADELQGLAAYFKAGLDNNERCLWVTGEPFGVEAARAALSQTVPDLSERESAGQIDIVDGGDFYDPDKPLPLDELVSGLLERADEAVAAGYNGLRTNGNCAWVGHKQWPDFQRYEDLVQRTVKGRRMICMCSYQPTRLGAVELMDVMEHHDMVLRADRALIAKRPAATEATPPAAAERLRTYDLAMVASQMGTWRYTLADNICVYDDNAQRLYGLTEARFLHDEAGVRAKFHPDDLELMWARVAKALDPAGDGRYDVEYRVKQLDGSWRWLSAWGAVEFEGEGEARRPVAITGASRDLTELKRAEELQRLLLNELNHRVKNTLATVQSIAAYTLRRAPDLQSGRSALDDRIMALARAHDLLMARNWSGADLRHVVDRALEPFSAAQLRIQGPSVEIDAGHALALSLALHELATNAAKYGALSTPAGRVDLRWSSRDGRTQLDWRESGGPPVTPPSRRGFGSRLLETSLARDLGGGGAQLEYAPDGLRCALLICG